MLTRCENCKVHVFADESRCPFCKGKRRVIGAKKSLAVAAGAIAFMSGIGCAYGCPAGECVGDVDGAAGDATTSDTSERPDVMVVDSSAHDSSVTDAMDASDGQLDGQTDALDAADADDG